MCLRVYLFKQACYLHIWCISGCMCMPLWFGGSRLYVSDWDVGVRCDIYVGVIVWSVKAFHNHTHSLPVVLLKSVYVWILICGKCIHSSSFKVWGSRQLWLDSAVHFFFFFFLHIEIRSSKWVACYLTLLCLYVCAAVQISATGSVDM